MPASARSSPSGSLFISHLVRKTYTGFGYACRHTVPPERTSPQHFFEQLNFGDIPLSPEELHAYMTAMFDRHTFKLNPPHLRPCTSERTFDDFRRYHHADLHIPYGDGDRRGPLAGSAHVTSPGSRSFRSEYTHRGPPHTLSQFTDILH